MTDGRCESRLGLCLGIPECLRQPLTTGQHTLLDVLGAAVCDIPCVSLAHFIHLWSFPQGSRSPTSPMQNSTNHIRWWSHPALTPAVSSYELTWVNTAQVGALPGDLYLVTHVIEGVRLLPDSACPSIVPGTVPLDK